MPLTLHVGLSDAIGHGSYAMPWRVTPPVDKRIHPAETHLSDAFTFAEVWDIFGISQNTGYKLSQRWKESGKWGPGDRSLTECSRCLGRPSHDYGPPADVLDDRVLA